MVLIAQRHEGVSSRAKQVRGDGNAAKAGLERLVVAALGGASKKDRVGVHPEELKEGNWIVLETQKLGNVLCVRLALPL